MIDYKKININRLTEFISYGCKEECKNIGVECEHFIVNSDNEAVNFYGDNGVCHILERLSVCYPQKSYSQNQLVGLNDGVVYITLEPAAQIEVSIIPLDSLEKISNVYSEFLSRINAVLSEYNYSLVTKGYQPKSLVDDLELIPKDRYEMMDSYFLSKGNKARYMMRGSASVQVNIDYIDEKDFALKFRLANILSPLFYLLTDNADVFEGKAYNGYSLRSWVWEQVDESRCGFYDFTTFEEYAEWIYSTEPIFIINDKEEFTSRKTNEEIFSDKELSRDHIKHIFSMVFPNVRVKQFIEIRTGDSLPFDLMIGYAAFIKGLFYNKRAVDKLNEIFCDITVDQMKNQMLLIRENGFDCSFYNMDLKALTEMVFRFAKEGLSEDERHYIEPLENISLKQKTPKDYLR